MVPRSEIFERYLSILGIEPEEPSHDHLRRLVRAQLIRVPFENISKLYLKKTRDASFIPSLEEHLDGIERFNFGGTCYANNPYFAELLCHCGYDVDICGADMTKPDVHVVSKVRLETSAMAHPSMRRCHSISIASRILSWARIDTSSTHGTNRVDPGWNSTATVRSSTATSPNPNHERSMTSPK